MRKGCAVRRRHWDWLSAQPGGASVALRKLVDAGYERAQDIIVEKGDALARIAEALLEREVLDGAEVRLLIEGGTLAVYSKSKPPEGGDKQQVIRPEGGKPVTGLLGGERPQPA